MPCARPPRTSTESSVGSPIAMRAPCASVVGCNFAGQASRAHGGASDDGGDRPQIIAETFAGRSRKGIVVPGLSPAGADLVVSPTWAGGVAQRIAFTNGT